MKALAVVLIKDLAVIEEYLLSRRGEECIWGGRTNGATNIKGGKVS